jgi:8-oxo-dGTP diphosphatase
MKCPEVIVQEIPFSLSVKILIENNEGRWLFLRRGMDCEWNPGRWDLPGGKIAAGESFEEALKREVFEETGLNVIILGLWTAIEDEIPTNRLVHLIMKGEMESGTVELSDEHDQYAWAAREAIPAMELCGYLRGLAAPSDSPDQT